MADLQYSILTYYTGFWAGSKGDSCQAEKKGTRISADQGVGIGVTGDQDVGVRQAGYRDVASPPQKSCDPAYFSIILEILHPLGPEGEVVAAFGPLAVPFEQP